MYIAIIEDDPSQAKLISVWLEKAGHACKIYPMGKIFIDNASNEQFDLLIIDWVLPDINGDDVFDVWHLCIKQDTRGYMHT